MSTPSALVQKLWNYCSILRDDGPSYGDHVEQLTNLLFLKMGDELETHYQRVLVSLGVIFRKAQNKIQDPAKLRQLDRITRKT